MTLYINTKLYVWTVQNTDKASLKVGRKEKKKKKKETEVSLLLAQQTA